MEQEQEKTLEGLRTAVQMETDGKAFYLKASQASGSEAGQKLLESLAAEEDIHLRKFEEIYRKIQQKEEWPEIEIDSDGGKNLETIFAREAGAVGDRKQAPAGEIEAAQTAMTMENRSYDFYKEQSENARYMSQKSFYEALAAQERGHYRVLQDYYDYLVDPYSWFVGKEHPTLDGS